jgi:hypothetical protein
MPGNSWAENSAAEKLGHHDFSVASWSNAIFHCHLILYTVIWFCWYYHSTRLIRCTMFWLCKSFWFEDWMSHHAPKRLNPPLRELAAMMEIEGHDFSLALLTLYHRPFHCHLPSSLLEDSAQHHLVQRSFSHHLQVARTQMCISRL